MIVYLLAYWKWLTEHRIFRVSEEIESVFYFSKGLSHAQSTSNFVKFHLFWAFHDSPQSPVSDTFRAVGMATDRQSDTVLGGVVTLTAAELELSEIFRR